MSPFKGQGLKRENFNLETNYIIEDFFVERSITLIYAGPKQGKSRFAIGLAKWLFVHTNFYPQYFDFDNPLSALSDRGVDDICDEGGDSFDYIHPEKIATTSKEALDKLVENAHGDVYAKYVFFFDSATDFADENSDGAVKVFMSKLKRLRNHGATIVLLHHANKNDKNYKGSTVFKSASDNVYSLKNEYEDINGTTFLLDVDAGRFKVKDSAFSLSRNGYILTRLNYEEVCIPVHEQMFIREIKASLQKEKAGFNQTKL